MSNDSTKEGVVIDVTPEHEEQAAAAEATTPDTDAPDAAPAPTDKAGRGLGGLALLVGVAALILVLAAGWFGHRQLQGLEQRLAAADSQSGETAGQARGLAERLSGLDQKQQALTAQLDGLRAQQQAAAGAMNDLNAAFENQSELLTRERGQLDERETQVRSLVANLHERVGRAGNQWQVAEAGYLLNLADHRLRLASDPDSARAALVIADQRLHATGDPGWAGVREQLARDIAALDTLVRVDLTGLWSRLGAQLEQVPRLRLREGARSMPRSDAPGMNLTPAEEERTWRTLLSDLWDGVKNAVRIRRHDEPVAAMLPPEQEYFLYENLTLKLQQARLALIQGREDIYRSTLAEARDWLASHFEPADAVTRGVDAALAELADTPIRTVMPDISTSLSVFQARRELLKSLPAPLPSPQPQTDDSQKAPTA